MFLCMDFMYIRGRVCEGTPSDHSHQCRLAFYGPVLEGVQEEVRVWMCSYIYT